MKILIKIYSNLDDEDFKIRYLIEDTIEDREIGTVSNVGTGVGYFDIVVVCGQNGLKDIQDIIESFGIEKGSIEIIECD